MNLIPQPFMAEKISENVYWVGAIDWTLPDFHGYTTPRGTTYNAYLIIADKITLIDTVKRPHLAEMMSRIASVIEPSKIDYIVSNHAELDHSGSMPEVIEMVKPEKLFASINGVKALKAHFPQLEEIEAVANGGKVELGNMELTCIETKMIHWPESMVSFLAKDKILFSQDAFGMHLASSKIFADQNERAILKDEVTKYYANIVLPYSMIVGKTIKALLGLGLDIGMIAPDHGPIWRTPEDISWILDLYKDFVNQKPTDKIVILYDTMWSSSAKMAKAIAEGVRLAGCNAKVMSMSTGHRSDVITEIMEAGALIIGSTTMNSGIYPTMADVLTYIRGLKPINLIGSVFGSYGWNKKAFTEMQGYLKAIGVEEVLEPMTVNFIPSHEDLMACREVGEKMAALLKAKL